jgi:hypothetical protein
MDSSDEEGAGTAFPILYPARRHIKDYRAIDGFPVLFGTSKTTSESIWGAVGSW